MNRIITLLALLIGVFGYSQVGIGTPKPSESAELEILSANKGILIPRVALTGLTDVTTITNGNVNSLMVFNTSNTPDLKPGYYYWYDTSWLRMVNQANVIKLIKEVGGNVYYDGDNLTYINNAGDTLSVNISDLIKSEETITTLDSIAQGVYRYSSEDGTITTINVPEDVINNFSEIINNVDVKNDLIELIKENGGNVYYDGDSLTYINNAGDTLSVEGLVTADNGLTKTGKNIKLGGALTEATEVKTDGAKTLAITGLEKGAITTDTYVVRNAAGVLKELKGAMPKFFYMPSIEMPTHNASDFTVLKNKTIELYALYVEQYGGAGYTGTATTAVGQARSNGSSLLPILPANELDYFVTYYDTTVFENVTVNADGQLKYSVKDDAIVTIKTFMNIVFKVKD